MRVYRAGNGKAPKKKRRALRIVGWMMLVLVIIGGAGAGAFYLYVQDVVAEIATPRAGDEPALEAIAPVTPGAGPVASRPAVFLLIGEDRRGNEGRGRSDTLMLVRVDPRKKMISLLSVSRDWIVDIPGYGPQAITESYILGGPKLAIETVSGATGVDINYYVSVDFNAFQRIVDAFDGAYLDVDRRYYNLNRNTAATDFASIDLEPGYQLMLGDSALSFVRHRHDDDDTFRLARQQAFLHEFKHKADPVTVSRNILDLLDVAKKNLKIVGKPKMGKDQLEEWANALRSTPKNNIVSLRPEMSRHPLDVNRITVAPAEIERVVDEFLDPDPTVPARAADQAAGKKPKAPTFTAAEVGVEVRNGNGTPGLAFVAEQDLRARGWAKTAANGDAPETFSSVIYHDGRKESLAAAKALQAVIQPSELKPLDQAAIDGLNAAAASKHNDDGLDVGVTVVLGLSFSQLARERETALPDAVKAEVISDRGRDVKEWQKAEKKVGYALMMPTRLPSDAVLGDPNFRSYQDFRVYRLRGKNALHVTYYRRSNPRSASFGFQALDWEEPPILKSPNEIRKFGGRDYKLYFNGAKLHRVAWRAQGKTYWLSNSLVDGLSNTTMWAIATGFKSVPN